MSYPFGYEVTKVKSNQTLNYDNFTGDISFSFTPEAEKWISPKNTFITIQLRITMTDDLGNIGTLKPIINIGTRAAPTVVSIPFINSNPVPALFSAISCEIGNQLISMTQNVASVNTLYKTLYESANEQSSVNSLCPINPLKIVDVDVVSNKPGAAILTDYYVANSNNATVPTTNPWPALTLSGHQIYAIKNQLGFNRFNEVDLAVKFQHSYF